MNDNRPTQAERSTAEEFERRADEAAQVAIRHAAAVGSTEDPETALALIRSASKFERGAAEARARAKALRS